MNNQFRFPFQTRPAWQRYLILAASIVIAAALIWVGMILVFSLAIVALGVAIANRIKMKITGRPLFAGPKHFHRYQSQYKQGNVIEGEVIEHNDDQHK